MAYRYVSMQPPLAIEYERQANESTSEIRVKGPICFCFRRSGHPGSDKADNCSDNEKLFNEFRVMQPVTQTGFRSHFTAKAVRIWRIPVSSAF